MPPALFTIDSKQHGKATWVLYRTVSDPTISHSDLLPDIFRSECQVQEPEKISSPRAWR